MKRNYLEKTVPAAFESIEKETNPEIPALPSVLTICREAVSSTKVPVINRANHES